MTLNYSIIVTRGKEKGYVAVCPALKGCAVQGRTIKSAIVNAKKAAKDYVECLQEDGLPVPIEIDHRTLSLKLAA